MTLEGQPVPLPGGLTTFTMEQGHDPRPGGAPATSLLFGLRGGTPRARLTG